MTKMFKGSIVALPTPFRDGRVDEAAFRRMIEWQLGQGTDGLLILGTTGEAPNLSDAEHERLIHLCMEVVDGKVPVMAGAGTNSTEKTIHYARQAKMAGADAVLAVSPYYNKPTQEGLFQHYKALNDAVDIPVFVYNIPSRCVVDISVETLVRLARLPHIVGIKDSNPDLKRPVQLRMHLGDDFCLLSGDEPSGLPFMAAGGDGVTTAVGNVIPKVFADMHRAWERGDFKAAFALHKKAMPLHLALYCETNPVPTKYALSLMGLCQPDVRLPLVELAEASKAKVRDAMRACGLEIAKAA